MSLLNAQQLACFHEKGFLRIENFYDVHVEIEPIQHHIYRIIGLLIEKHGLPVQRRPFSSETFDDGMMALLQHDRTLGGIVYDSVKQIPAFIRLLASPKHEVLNREIRQTDLSGIAAAGYGIRIDIPFEEKYQAPWHQDYPNQLRSLDGLVFWSPLVSMTPELGPVKFCVGSHHEGPLKVQMGDPQHPDKTGGYAMLIEKEQDVISKYPWESPLAQVGDLIIIDFLTIHASTLNRSNRPRWSMQMRYFNFNDPTGIQLNWCGSFSAGVKLSQVVPDLVSS